MWGPEVGFLLMMIIFIVYCRFHLSSIHLHHYLIVLVVVILACGPWKLDHAIISCRDLWREFECQHYCRVETSRICFSVAKCLASACTGSRGWMLLLTIASLHSSSTVVFVRHRLRRHRYRHYHSRLCSWAWKPDYATILGNLIMH